MHLPSRDPQAPLKYTPQCRPHRVPFSKSSRATGWAVAQGLGGGSNPSSSFPLTQGHELGQSEHDGWDRDLQKTQKELELEVGKSSSPGSCRLQQACGVQ